MSSVRVAASGDKWGPRSGQRKFAFLSTGWERIAGFLKTVMTSREDVVEADDGALGAEQWRNANKYVCVCCEETSTTEYVFSRTRQMEWETVQLKITCASRRSRSGVAGEVGGRGSPADGWHNAAKASTGPPPASNALIFHFASSSSTSFTTYVTSHSALLIGTCACVRAASSRRGSVYRHSNTAQSPTTRPPPAKTKPVTALCPAAGREKACLPTCFLRRESPSPETRVVGQPSPRASIQ